MKSFFGRLFAFVAVVGGFGSEGAGCNIGGRNIGLALSLPRDLIEGTTWFEVGAYKGATCAAIVPMLPNGVPEGETARVAFRRTDPSPRFGDIPGGNYAFAAVARDDNCGIIASGCVENDIDSVTTVSIDLTGSTAPTGTCPKGASCQAAKCVPAIDNSDPSIGAGCSLELLGTGPLATPLGGTGTLLSAPVIFATAAGSFIIGYREIDPNGAGARIMILPIDSAGGVTEAQKVVLADPCASSDQTDGVGVVINGESAMMALTKAPCAGKPPELQLLNFTSELAIGKFIVTQPGDDATLAVSLGAARSAATRPGGSLVVYTDGKTARVANMAPEDGIVPPIGTFGGRGRGITDAWIAANDKVLALLALSSEDAPTGDAGTDGGGARPDETTARLRLQLLPSDTDISKLAAEDANPITFPGNWGSIAASQNRVIVISDGTGPGQSVTYRAFDLGNSEPSTNGFSVEGVGKVTSGDVAIVGNRAYFASLKPRGVALHVFGNATTRLTPIASALLAHETRISAMSTVRDGRVAVAATPARVAVAWTTAKVLDFNDPTGGYAVFGCTE